MVTVDPIISASPNQVSGVLNGETVLLSSTTDIYYGLGEVGSRIWELIQQRKRISEICTQIACEFEVEAEVCQRDARELIQKLVEADLVKLEE